MYTAQCDKCDYIVVEFPSKEENVALYYQVLQKMEEHQKTHNEDTPDKNVMTQLGAMQVG